MNDLPDWKAMSAADRMAIISPLWLDGLSNSTIAARFTGATRNSVIGQIHRAKLKRVPSTPKAKPANRVRKIKYADKEPVTEKVSIKATPVRHAPLMAETVNPDIPVALDAMITTNRPPLAGIAPISILELPPRSGTLCRFPVVGGYCGAACGDQVYCDIHYRKTHISTDKIRVPREARR